MAFLPPLTATGRVSCHLGFVYISFPFGLSCLPSRLFASSLLGLTPSSSYCLSPLGIATTAPPLSALATDSPPPPPSRSCHLACNLHTAGPPCPCRPPPINYFCFPRQNNGVSMLAELVAKAETGVRSAAMGALMMITTVDAGE